MGSAKKNSNVYQGDTIRTSELSETSITFADGTSLEVYENSMLRLDFSGNEQSFELTGGALHISGGKSPTGATRVIRIGKSVVDVPSESDVSLLETEGVISVDVTEGAVSLKSETGAVTSVAENTGMRLDTNTGESEVVVREISAVAPEQGARYHSVNADDEVVFTGKASGDLSGAFIDLSSDQLFSVDVKSVPARVDPDGSVTARSHVEPGVRYWRIRAESGELSPTRRFTLSRSVLPQAIRPDDGTTIRFRKLVPKVRFSWSESPEAVSYVLEIARDRNGADVAQKLRTNLTGMTLASLGEGVWYWRVVPEYSQELLRSPELPPFRYLAIIKSPEMQAVKPLVPADGLMYEVQKGKVSGMAFSWQEESEASEYELRIYRAEDTSRAHSAFRTNRTWINLDAATAPFIATAGSWQWNVVWIDAEGNVSPPSDTRKLDGVDGLLAISPSFPPEGYVVSESLMGNVRFVWKTNIKAHTVFQVSVDPSFSEIAVEKPVDTETLLGLDCKQGRWFWRLRTFNADGSVFLETPPRSFAVVPPLPAPVLLKPASGSAVTVGDADSVEFRWSGVESADYYQCRLFLPSGENPETPLFSMDAIMTPACSVPLGALPGGAYRVVLQAFAADSEKSTRIIGYSSESKLFVGKLVPVELLEPGNGMTVSALEARRRGVSLKWRLMSVPDELILSVTRNGVQYPVALKLSAGSTDAVLPGLYPGKYSWSVRARMGGSDMSSRGPFSFTVSPVSPLPAPKPTSPPDATVFDPDYFVSRTHILFSWKPVPGATQYALRIRKADSGSLVFTDESIPEPSYRLEDLSCLDKGNFTWEISAQNVWTDGVTDQKSDFSRPSRFLITLPQLELPKQKKDAEYYGN